VARRPRAFSSNNPERPPTRKTYHGSTWIAGSRAHRTLAGQTFLIADLNGTAGYQANADLVIHLTGATGTLAATTFI
jgi:hypothetical protein